MTAAVRTEFITRSRLCFCCLGKHGVRDCQLHRRCFKCQGRHHTLIHLDEGSELVQKTLSAGSRQARSVPKTVSACGKVDAAAIISSASQ